MAHIFWRMKYIIMDHLYPWGGLKGDDDDDDDDDGDGLAGDHHMASSYNQGNASSWHAFLCVASRERYWQKHVVVRLFLCLHLFASVNVCMCALCPFASPRLPDFEKGSQLNVLCMFISLSASVSCVWVRRWWHFRWQYSSMQMHLDQTQIFWHTSFSNFLCVKMSAFWRRNKTTQFMINQWRDTPTRWILLFAWKTTGKVTQHHRWFLIDYLLDPLLDVLCRIVCWCILHIIYMIECIMCVQISYI